ncbi:MAG: hypothetical protein ACFCGT_18525 [Sandaracinaceae bacterium]
MSTWLRSLVFVLDEPVREVAAKHPEELVVVGGFEEARAAIRSATAFAAVVCSMSCDPVVAGMVIEETRARWRRPLVERFVLTGRQATAAGRRARHRVDDAQAAVELALDAHGRGVRTRTLQGDLAAAMIRSYGLTRLQGKIIRLLSLGLHAQHIPERLGQQQAAHNRMKSRIYELCGVDSHGGLMELLYALTTQLISEREAPQEKAGLRHRIPGAR